MADATRKNDRASPLRANEQDQERTRINLVYRGTEMDTLLRKLQRLGHHGTVTETVARALRVYEAFLDERENGNQIIVQSKSGNALVRLV